MKKNNQFQEYDGHILNIGESTITDARKRFLEQQHQEFLKTINEIGNKKA